MTARSRLADTLLVTAALGGLTLLSALVPLACGGATASDDFAVARSDALRDTSPNVPPADRDALAAGNTAFALDLYRALGARSDLAGQNLFFSPYSVSVALAMTSAGARGPTHDEMATALHFTLPDARLHPAFDALDLALESRGAGAKGATGLPFRLHLTNATFGQQGLAFERPFLDTMAIDYGADIKLVDFVAAPESARTDINAWVARQTEQRIEELLPKGSISHAVRLVLVNAIYFDAAWETPFVPTSTKRATFHGAGGAEADVDMMEQTIETTYAAGDGWEAFELPYDGHELAMTIVLPPPGGLAALETKLDAPTLAAVVGGLHDAGVHLHLPKFRYEGATFSLKDTLAGLGMRLAFTGDADFSGITTADRLQILDVFHRAFLAVDEKGTEAAAATAVVAGKTAAPDEHHEVVVDRPFVFLIRDLATGTIVFMGRVESLPAAG